MNNFIKKLAHFDGFHYLRIAIADSNSITIEEAIGNIRKAAVKIKDAIQKANFELSKESEGSWYLGGLNSSDIAKRIQNLKIFEKAMQQIDGPLFRAKNKNDLIPVLTPIEEMVGNIKQEMDAIKTIDEDVYEIIFNLYKVCSSAYQQMEISFRSLPQAGAISAVDPNQPASAPSTQAPQGQQSPPGKAPGAEAVSKKEYNPEHEDIYLQFDSNGNLDPSDIPPKQTMAPTSGAKIFTQKAKELTDEMYFTAVDTKTSALDSSITDNDKNHYNSLRSQLIQLKQQRRAEIERQRKAGRIDNATYQALIQNVEDFKEGEPYKL